MPMLLEYQKVNLNEFLNISVIEDSMLIKNEKQSAIFLCNLEQIITNT